MRLSIVFIVLTDLSGYACATSKIDTYGNTTYLDDGDGIQSQMIILAVLSTAVTVQQSIFSETAHI